MGDERPSSKQKQLVQYVRWTSVRKIKEGETTDDLFAFLTTAPNAIVAAIQTATVSLRLT